MAESTALIRSVLQKAGVELEFATSSIFGIPGFELQVLYKGEESIYEVERQNFSFQIAAADIVEEELSSGMQFTCTDDAYIFTFEIRGFEPDLTGWAFMKVDFISKVAA